MLATDDGTRWVLTKTELQALSRIMSKDPGRQSLTGLAFDPQKRWAFSTDGHRAMCAAPDGSEGTDDVPAVLVPAATVHAALKASRSRDLTMWTITKSGGTFAVYSPPGREIFDWGDRAVTVDVVTAQCTPAGVQGTFVSQAAPPPLSQVLPQYEAKPPKKAAPMVGLNPAYLANAADLAKIQPDRDVPVKFWHAGELDPVLLIMDTDHGVTWRLVIMPFRL